MSAANLQHAVKKLALFANLLTLEHAKKRLIGVVGSLQIHQLRVVVAVSLWAAQAEQRRVLHRENGDDGLEKQFGINVSSLINNNDICARAARSLRWIKNIVS